MGMWGCPFQDGDVNDKVVRQRKFLRAARAGQPEPPPPAAVDLEAPHLFEANLRC